MKASNDVIQFLKSDSILDTLLGVTGSNPRIYPLVAPQNQEYPFIVYSIVSEGTAEEILLEFSMQFSIYDDEYDKVQDIEQRLKYLLDLQDNINISSTDYRFEWCKLASSVDLRDEENEALSMNIIFDFKVIKIT